MDIFDVLSMIGGLALFLYGMHLLGEGLEKMSGGRLERILEKLTSNPIKGVLLGAAVTAVIQSSSATTVMVVGFVNSGIMKLGQAVSIIMGANIGTTVTSWILSLTSIEGDSILLQLLKPTNFTTVLALIGVIFIMFIKNEKKKNVGMILVGFAVLMVGMDNMSEAVKPLRDVPEFTNILLMFSNPILGMIAGAVLTAIIQSSSASVGILQALCVTGQVPFATALPIIMGQNIGTCVTALISSIGAQTNAKRAALVHLYFNVVGTVLFMLGFYGINAVVDFAFLNTPADAAGIATIHTVFNVVATLLLLPFSKLLEKLACLTVKEAKDPKKEQFEQQLQLLDERFLETPALAVEHCKVVANHMAEIAKEALDCSLELLKEYDEKTAKRVFELESEADRFEDHLGQYLVQLSSKDLSVSDSATLSMLLHSIGDMERISDHAVNITEAAEEMHQKKMTFSTEAEKEIATFSDAVREILRLSIESFIKEDGKEAVLVEPLEEVVDDLRDELKNRHVNRLREGKCTIELGFVLSDLTTNFERVADHCSNIAACLIQTGEHDFEMHKYIHKLAKGEDTPFHERYMEYRKQYRL
ncbi:MAG: Na/Pi cotransporter family protein [Lachnospiraceae bacterium]|nr:Na/Pi cotransporter family protein [Lachnospiraceae bacterium]